jgi:microcystin-dependent protein
MASSAVSGSMVVNFPAGMVIPYAGAAIPPGWLECNGAEVDISAHPVLAAALGSTWNTAKNPLTNVNYAAPAAGKFRLPDMRGAFLRGSSGGANNAQGVATGLAEFQAHKTAKNGLSNAASSLSALTLNASSVSGSVGGGDGAHAHRTGALVGANAGSFHTWSASPTQTGGTYGFGYGDHAVSATNSGHGHGISLTSSAQSLSSGAVTAQTITGDSETRPDSVGVRYLIKC